MSCIITNASYLNSTWVASDLPIIYRIDNDKFPTNSTDAIEAISSMSDDYGYTKLLFTSPSTVAYSEGSFVQITGSSNSENNGVWRVKKVYDSSNLTLDMPFTGNSSCSIQRYYNNYHIVVNVYTGLRANHYHEAENPMKLTGTLRIRPDQNNYADVDISSFVRAELSPIENRFCEMEFDNGWANDFNQFTQFYVEFAESYDIAESKVLKTFTSNFTEDQDIDGNAKIYSATKSAHAFQYNQGKSMAEYAINSANYDGGGKWMTSFEKPTYFEGFQYDVAIINDYTNDDIDSSPHTLNIIEKNSSGTTVATTLLDVSQQDEGLYRFNVNSHSFDSSTTEFEMFISYVADFDTLNTQTKTFKLWRGCNTSKGVYLRWINQLGNWEGFLFTRNIDRSISIGNRTTVTRDIFTDFDTVFTHGTTQDDYISTSATENRVVRTHLLTEDEAIQVGRNLRLSNKVQQIYPNPNSNCGDDLQRTVLIGSGDFTYLSDSQRLREVEISFRYTDNIIIQGQ